jgi:hypothetical protein
LLFRNNAVPVGEEIYLLPHFFVPGFFSTSRTLRVPVSFNSHFSNPLFQSSKDEAAQNRDLINWFIGIFIAPLARKLLETFHNIVVNIDMSP